MSAVHIASPVARAALVLRWTARVGSVACILLLSMFAFGGGEPGTPTAAQSVALAFFPTGVAIGMLLGWWREGLGGLVTLVSLVLFYAWMIVMGGRVPGGPWFVIFSSPGLLFLVCWLLERARRDQFPVAA